MKLTQPRKAGHSDVTPISLLRRLGRITLLLIAVAFVFVIFVFLTNPVVVQNASRDLEERWGEEFREFDVNLSQKVVIAIGAYLRQMKDGTPDIPELIIDVPFREISRIYEIRQNALDNMRLIQGPDDFVRGEIRFENRVIPVKLRLKGDWTDHLYGLKWSFRIHTRNDEQILGMRRFSIQNPGTRGYQSELLFFRMLDRYGVMRPRYEFVEVTLNGESMGIMALEEFFTKELLEYNRRREGVIIRFDESKVWEAVDSPYGEVVGWGGAFDHYSNAAIDAFGSARIAESPVLTKQYEAAEGLLRGFVDGSLQPSEVFDAKQMGSLIGIADVFGSAHTMAWHNLRFYLNPITMRLEPIAFDITLQDRFTGIDSVINDEPMIARLVNDPAIWEHYARVLRELAAGYTDGSLETYLREEEEEPFRLLQTEFRLLNRFPLDYLQARLDALLDTASKYEAAEDKESFLYFFAGKEVFVYPAFANLGLLQNAAGHLLKVETTIPRDVRITRIRWFNEATGKKVDALVRPEELPFNIPARGIGSTGEKFQFALRPPPEATGWIPLVTAGMRGRHWVKEFPVARIYPPLVAVPLPESTLDVQLAAHSFLKLAEPNVLRIDGGTWQVKESLIIPKGYSLHVGAGTMLRFAADALLLSKGPIRLAGKAFAPIVLEPADGKGWPGLVVMEAGKRSVLEHVVVKGTTSVVTDAWTLTGGVNFYASDVQLSNCELHGSQGEDALNIIHSEFELLNTVIDGTASDAFDADFADGSVKGGEFRNIGTAGGGDAIDVSGSRVTVIGTHFENVSDKALSVGEKSELDARDVTIGSVGTGAASKDGSRLLLSDAKISNASFAGLTAYIKKPEYGAAEIVAQNVRIDSAETPVLVQTGSRVQLDGTEQETRDINVAALYETVMRPGLRR
ncbi:MAG: CotH kinase family protein [Gammaproteobacteria bacterium]|jgi:hypothetical protein|nr:CotH kinase family protein [Gammaproteobacteria bacterium]MDP6617746.1 CotH kinase family protein [Gammaproteobacteria bacterium]MDP6694132.1 CotH kinase family protein [Gammaproteobacteria bacterium]